MYPKRSFGKEALILLLILWIGDGSFAWSAEALVEEAGVVLDLPNVWFHKTEKNKIPTGQLMQRWVRAPIQTTSGPALPGIVAIATPAPEGANLALLTQAVLSREPYNIQLGKEGECLKCVRYRARVPQGIAYAFSFEPPRDCVEAPLDDPRGAACHFQRIEMVRPNLEPSWAFRLEKETPGGKMRVLLVHALVDGKLLDVTFWYPVDSARFLETEIGRIISSMRRQRR